jgi:hypothetical protein
MPRESHVPKVLSLARIALRRGSRVRDDARQKLQTARCFVRGSDEVLGNREGNS